MPPPRTNPPTPMLEARPPTVAKPYGSSAEYTDNQLLPGSIEATDLSALRVTAFISLNQMLIPPTLLEAPLKAAWPPLLAANGHPVSRESSTAILTSVFLEGRNTQCGWASSCCTDQKELVKLLYSAEFCALTFCDPKRKLKLAHCL